MAKKHAIIPIFISHQGCPNDCVFCNQKKITAYDHPMSLLEMERQVETYLSTLDAATTMIEIAFYGGSFTGIEANLQEIYLSSAHKYLKQGRIHKIRLSTRPDYLSPKVIDRLKAYDVSLVEIGVQSLDDGVLQLSKRGYDEACVRDSVLRLKAAGIDVGIQLMIGLPGDDFEKLEQTTQKVVALAPKVVRIYPTLVIEDTFLAMLYQTGQYVPLDLETAVKWTAAMAKQFNRAQVQIIRMGLQPTEFITQGQSVLTGPFHPAFRQLVESEIMREVILKRIEQDDTQRKQFKMYVNGKTTSIAVGQKQSNLNFFRGLGYQMSIGKDETLFDGDMRLEWVFSPIFEK